MGLSAVLSSAGVACLNDALLHADRLKWTHNNCSQNNLFQSFHPFPPCSSVQPSFPSLLLSSPLLPLLAPQFAPASPPCPSGRPCFSSLLLNSPLLPLPAPQFTPPSLPAPQLNPSSPPPAPPFTPPPPPCSSSPYLLLTVLMTCNNI